MSSGLRVGDVVGAPSLSAPLQETSVNEEGQVSPGRRPGYGEPVADGSPRYAAAGRGKREEGALTPRDGSI
jgi:hypothetical protein